MVTGTGPLTDRDLKNLVKQIELTKDKLDNEITKVANLESRVGFLERQIKDLNDACDDNDIRIRELEITVGRLSERTTLFQLGQATWSTVASIISTILSINLR